MIFQGVDLADAAALRSAYALVRTYDPPYEFEIFFRTALERVQVGREPDFIRAVTAWPDFGVFELRYLLDAFASRWPKQVSLRNALRDAVLSACRREPHRVYRRGWNTLLPFEKLDKENLVPDGDVVRATVEGFAAQVDSLEAGELFHLLEFLATY